MFTLLNTSILTLTAYGLFNYEPTTLEEAKRLISTYGYSSAVGHQATAEILTELLGLPVEMNRVNYIQGKGSQAIVFKLKSRIAEGVILTKTQIEEIGYEFGILTRLQ